MAGRGPALGLLSAVTVVAVAAMAGCTTQTAPPPATFSPPAWFAEQAQEREEFQSALQACMDAKGWQLTVGPYGGFDEPFTDEGEMERATAEMRLCRQALGYAFEDERPPLTADEFGRVYDMLLDVRACLRAQGLDMAAPPSRESWVDRALEQQAATDELPSQEPDPADWHPYNDPELMYLPADRYAELERLCPQPWAP